AQAIHGIPDSPPESVPCCTVETSSLEHGIPHCRRKSTLDTQTSQSELSLADAMHQFDTGDRNRRVAKPLKPSIVAIRCFTPRWSCSIRLFKYFDDRTFVSAGSKPSAFTSRTAR